MIIFINVPCILFSWISISSDKVIYIHSINGGRSLHSLLLTVDKNCNVFLLSSVLFRLFDCSEFSFTLCHDDGHRCVSLPRRICRLRMVSPFDNPPVPDPGRPFLTLGTEPLVHVGPVCSVHIPTNGAFGLICILPMIGPGHFAMTAALLAVRIEVANFYGLTAAFLPLNLHIGFVHIVLTSQRPPSPGANSDPVHGVVIWLLRQIPVLPQEPVPDILPR